MISIRTGCGIGIEGCEGQKLGEEMFGEGRGEHTACLVDRASKVPEVLEAMTRLVALRHGRWGRLLASLPLCEDEAITRRL